MSETFRIFWIPKELEINQIAVSALVDSPESVRLVIEKSIQPDMSFAIYRYATVKLPPSGKGNYSRLPNGPLAVEQESGTCQGFLAALFPGGSRLRLRTNTSA